MIIEPVLKFGAKALTRAKRTIKPMCEFRTMESLGLKMEQLTCDLAPLEKAETITGKTKSITKSITTKPTIMYNRH